MLHEIKKNICDIATDVFRDTQVLFAYLYGSYAVDQAHPFSDKDWIMVSIEKISRKFIQLDEYLQILDEMAKIAEDAFLKDKILIGSAK